MPAGDSTCACAPRRMRTACRPAASAGTNVVVDPVADVEDLLGRHARLFHHVREEPGVGLLDAPALGRADEVDVRAQELLVVGVHVPAPRRGAGRVRATP